MLGKTEAGREFQFLEVIRTNVLANEVVRHFSNLTAKECWESAKRVLRSKDALEGITDFNSTLTGAPAMIVSIVKGKRGDISSSRVSFPVSRVLFQV